MTNLFQEVALIEGGRRTATIVCKTNVELLVILKEVTNHFIKFLRFQIVHKLESETVFVLSQSCFQYLMH